MTDIIYGILGSYHEDVNSARRFDVRRIPRVLVVVLFVGRDVLVLEDLVVGEHLIEIIMIMRRPFSRQRVDRVSMDAGRGVGRRRCRRRILLEHTSHRRTMHIRLVMIILRAVDEACRS